MASIAGFEWSVPAPFGSVLKVFKDGKLIDSVELSGRPYTILGRKREMCHYVMEHETISRQHAVIGADSDGTIYLVDNKSTHGSFVNRQKLIPQQKHAIHPTDDITFGGSTRNYKLALPIAAASASDLMAPPPPRMPKSQQPVPTSLPNGLNPSTEDDDGFLTPDAVKAIAPSHTTDSKASSSKTQPAPSASAESRKQREAEIAAMVESLKRPITFTAAPSVAADSGGSGTSTQSSRLIDETKIGKLLQKAGHSAETLGSNVPRREASVDDDDDYEDDDEEGDDDDADMQAAAAMGLPVAFGGSSKAKKTGAAKRARVEPTSAGAGAADDVIGDENQMDGAPSADHKLIELGLPVSQEVVLQGGNKTVTAIALDPAGGRLMLGSSDYVVRFYDFGGMDAEHKHFREITPQDGHSIVALSYSPSGDRFIVGTTSSKPVIYDRDGNKLRTFMKGDMYITDVTHTKGHVGAVSGSVWHPVNPDYVITSSLDSTIRLWNLNGKMIFDELLCTDVIRVKNQREKRAAVTTLAVSSDGRNVFGGLDDGSVYMYGIRTPGHKYLRPDAAVKNAHKAMDDAVTGIAVAANGVHVATRGQDQTVKVWDLRKFDDRSGPVVTIEDVPTFHSTANVEWSPNSRMLAVPIDPIKGKGDGKLAVYDVLEGVSKSVLNAGSDSVHDCMVLHNAPAVVVRWHYKINQLFVGCGDGNARVLFDPEMSVRGALLSSARSGKRKNAIDSLQFASHGRIIAPNALPLFRDDATAAGHKRKLSEMKHDKPAYAQPALTAPALPTADNPDFLNEHSKSFTQYFVQNTIRGPNIREQDPTEVLRAYAAKAAEDKNLIKSAYAKTQPKPVLASTTIEEEEERAKAERDAFLRGNIAGK